MLESLDAAAVHRWCVGGLAGMRLHQREIDDLNVYPVPDGDTGTNLVLTLTAAERAMSAERGLQRGGGHGEALRVLARGALLGARGNSGVILSQILRGLADTLAGFAEVRGEALAVALRAAAEAAYQAVVEPAEGTILTVVSAAARGAGAAGSDDLATVARAATAAAARALAQTPQQLPALARAGVVDAGGRGLVVLLEALVEVVTGAPATGGDGHAAARTPADTFAARGVEAPAAARGLDGGPHQQDGGPHRQDGACFEYEVQYLLDADAAPVARLKATLAGLGDSIVVVGTGSEPGEEHTWNVHVHVNDIGGAIEAGVVAGRPHRISVTPLIRRRATTPAATVDPDARAAVVVASGGGLAALFRAEGAAVVGGNPSPEEILAAVRESGAGQVVVLPNDPDTRAVAAVAAREAHAHGVRVRVVPTRSPVQALAALAVRDPRRRFDDDVIAMAEAAGACRYGEACYASREALTVAGVCRPGDVLGLVDGEVHVIGAELEESCRALLDRMLGGGGELVTLVLGAEAPTDLDAKLRAHLATTWPFADIQSYDGGQPFYPLLVGVE